MGLTMLESTYAQYFGLVHTKPFIIRTTFVLLGVFNVIGKLITGHMLDKHQKAPVIFSVVGNLFMFLPFIHLATLPYWNISEVAKQWSILVNSPFLSCGFVFIYISAVSRMHQMELSHINEVDTSALISG